MPALPPLLLRLALPFRLPEQPCRLPRLAPRQWEAPAQDRLAVAASRKGRRAPPLLQHRRQPHAPPPQARPEVPPAAAHTNSLLDNPSYGHSIVAPSLPRLEFGGRHANTKSQ